MAKFTEAISALYERLDDLIDQERALRRTINDLSAIDGLEPPFPDIDTVFSTGVRGIRSDQFFGKSLNGAVKEFLRITGRAVPAKEILEGLKRGGFEFPPHWGKDHWLKNLSISISKNRNDFVYVKSSDSWGLWDFYPEKKRERESLRAAGLPESSSLEGEATGEDVIIPSTIPAKRRRGRPSKAEMEARRLAQEQQQKQEQSSPPPQASE